MGAFAILTTEPNALVAKVRQKRQELLDCLAVKEHGLVFRYIPAGTFLMGSNEGDPDEQPVHSVDLDHYWLSETPVSWDDFCRLLEWEPPPNGMPKDAATERRKQDKALWAISAMNRVRLQYCEDETLHARDWHSHGRVSFSSLSTRPCEGASMNWLQKNQ